MEESGKSHPPTPSKMSKVPSWISLGFVLGAFFVWALPKPEAPAPIAAPPRIVEPPRVPHPTKLTTIEELFANWGSFAVWDRDMTEVAYWNPGTEKFTEFYEIRRNGDALYFRSIPKLTRRIINHGKAPPPECPLQFTETEEQYREWRETGRVERSATDGPTPRPDATFVREELPRPAGPSIESIPPAAPVSLALEASPEARGVKVSDQEKSVDR